MTLNYPWICKACGSPNAIGISAYSKCGMSAQVSSEEVALAKGDDGVEAVHASHEVKRVNAENWKALPAWRKLLVIAASSIIIAGLGWLKFAVLTLDTLSALDVVVFGLGLIFKLGAMHDGDE